MPDNGTVIKTDGELTGYLALESGGSIGGTVTIPELIDVSHREHYDGSYTVTSRPDRDLYLATRDKVMDDDMTIQKIAYHETSNVSGGLTAYIA